MGHEGRGRIEVHHPVRVHDERALAAGVESQVNPGFFGAVLPHEVIDRRVAADAR